MHDTVDRGPPALETVRQLVLQANTLYELKWSVMALLQELTTVREALEAEVARRTDVSLPALEIRPAPSMPQRRPDGKFLPKEHRDAPDRA